MTVGANHLHAAAVRSEKIRLQMQVMIELNGSRVASRGSQRGKFRMIAFKTADVADETGGVPARHEVRVALRAVRVARGGQSNRSPVIGVAGSA